MRNRLLMSLLLIGMVLGGCADQDAASGPEASAAVEQVITRFHKALDAAYAGRGIDLGAEVDRAFDPNARLVTYWGVEEPIDTTKARMLNGVGNVKDYMNAVENIETRVYGTGAVLSCIVRQEYELAGHRIDEFLPTTYVLELRDGHWKVVFMHRSADFQTIQQQLEITREP
jgi:hypothetical protein